MSQSQPTVGELLLELDRLKAHHADEQAQVALDVKRKLADLGEIHNANRLVTVGTLTVGMAHEFGTPLGVVLARAQMILTDDQDIQEARKDAGEIVLQVKRMTQMCRDVLDYARPKAPAKVAVDVVQLSRQLVLMLQPDARKRSAVLTLQEAPPSWVLGDASKLTQILTNLVINAAQSMPRGGAVTISIERKRVRPPAVKGTAEAEYICIHVKDAGTGIRAADLAHIFETFFTTKKEGTGLGLAVSYHIARDHDGWIDVVTDEGKGSTFTVYLPPLSS